MTKPKRTRVKPRPKLAARADLVRVVRPKAQWSELVLPAAQSKVLQRMVASAKTGVTAGPGAIAVFTGASGTCKTLAAEVMAGELGRPLYRVDLAAVVSKYIGETEKNLRRVFDAAETAGAILFFDEADALFGKRSEVKDSHDRYANIEVNYLLQRLEEFQGLAILATNAKANLDPAFLRRLRYVVAFPRPRQPKGPARPRTRPRKVMPRPSLNT